ncbi:MAG: hypothetical protein ACK5Q5_22445 [Planctomycetaceae bacterium]
MRFGQPRGEEAAEQLVTDSPRIPRRLHLWIRDEARRRNCGVAECYRQILEQAAGEKSPNDRI